MKTRAFRSTGNSIASTAASPRDSFAAIDSPASVRWWRLFLVVITLVVFLPALRNGFLNWDDNQHIIDNPMLRSGRFLQFWVRPYFGLYIPITYSIWALFAAVNDGGPPNALVFHALNVVVHAGTVLIVFETIRRLTRSTLAAGIGAMLFAVHPMQVEPVAWVSGFRDVLGGFWAVLAIQQYLAARDAGVLREPSPRFHQCDTFHYLLATLAFVLALLSKPTTVVVPLLCFALDRQKARRSAAMGWLALWLGFGLVAGWITRLAQPAIALHGLGILDHILVAGDALSFYLMKLVLPISLGMDYGRTPAMVLARSYWLGAIEFLPPLMLVVVAWAGRTRFPLLWRGLLAGLISLTPVLGFASFDFQRYSTVADRYMYLPLLGIAIAVSSLVPALRRYRFALPAVGLLVLVFAARSFAQSFVWFDGASLFSHALAVNNKSAIACSQLATLWLNAGNPDEAQKWARLAFERDPDAGEYFTFLGLVASRRVPPDFVTAENSFRTALAHDPKMLPALTNLAALLAQQGNLSEAQQLCRRALAIEPSDVSAHINLGNVLASQGRTAAAQSEYAAALAISPENQQAQTNWAAVLAQTGMRPEAEEHLQKALEIDPNYPPALRLLGLLRRGG